MLNRFKKWLPSKGYIKSHKNLRWISHLLQDDDLWHITEKSTSRATLIGLFVAFVPLPFQMLLAVLAGLPLRANLYIAALLVWISNPLTMGPLYFMCYLLGKRLIHNTQQLILEPTSIHDWLTNFHLIWKPLFLGCGIVGISLSLLGFLIVKGYWKLFQPFR